MNSAKWLKRCAMVVVLSHAAVAIAQEDADDIFGVAPAATPPAAEAAVAEKSESAEGLAVDANLGNDFCKCVGEANSPTVAKIEKALASPLRSQGLDFADTPLEKVVNQIQDEYEFLIEIDTAALDEIGIGTDEPVTIRIHGISLRSALRLTLSHLQLTYVIRDEVLMITTPEAAEQELLVCVYDVRDILGPAKDQAVDQLIDAIVSCVMTDTWAENGGGEAEIRWLKPGFLVISQTQAVHEEIGALLAAIRDVRKRSSNQNPDAADAAAAAESNRVLTRFYPIRTDDDANADAVRNQIRELITESLPDERWKGKLSDGQPVGLTILPDRVIVRHKPAVQEKVAELLTDSGLVAPPSRPRGTFGGGGFGGAGQTSAGQTTAGR